MKTEPREVERKTAADETKHVVAFPPPLHELDVQVEVSFMSVFSLA